ncbi:MAG: hypothetical protein AABZ77_08855 [Chloroflexota bacterium]
MVRLRSPQVVRPIRQAQGKLAHHKWFDPFGKLRASQLTTSGSTYSASSGQASSPQVDWFDFPSATLRVNARLVRFGVVRLSSGRSSSEPQA